MTDSTSTAELVYSDRLTSLYRGDARELPLDDGSIDLIITSPPYNCRARYDGYDDWLDWASYWRGLIAPAMAECYRVLRPGGRLCVNFANVVRQNVPEGQTNPPEWKHKGHWRWTPPGSNGDWPALVDRHIWPLLVDEIGFLERERISWVKGDRADDVTTTSNAWGSWLSAANPSLRATSEPIYVADKILRNHGTGTTDITKEEFMAWTRNTWFVPVRNLVTGRGANPCQFPLEIPRRLMKLYGFKEDVILDPFTGEGTTLRAAKNEGRQSIGVEQGEDQCRRAAGRCKQGVLFDEGEIISSPKQLPVADLATQEALFAEVAA